MNANKRGLYRCMTVAVGGWAVASMMLFPAIAEAEQGLNAGAQSKVNIAKSKRWSTCSGKDCAKSQDEKTVVNLGSKRAGTCNVNVGTVQPGQKAPKEIVVTTKEVINVCK